MFLESQLFAELGDYSKPADRRAVLGRLHQYKSTAWEEHLMFCSGEGRAFEPLDPAPEPFDLPDDLGDDADFAF